MIRMNVHKQYKHIRFKCYKEFYQHLYAPSLSRTPIFQARGDLTAKNGIPFNPTFVSPHHTAALDTGVG